MLRWSLCLSHQSILLNKLDGRPLAIQLRRFIEESLVDGSGDDLSNGLAAVGDGDRAAVELWDGRVRVDAEQVIDRRDNIAW